MKKFPLILVLLMAFSCNNSQKYRVKSAEQEQAPETFTIQPKQFIAHLPNQLSESSGLIFYKNLFWSFNDSGGEPELYAFNSRGELIHKVELKNAENHDWESITQDFRYIYVGDFGNNSGTRKNLSIYKIKKNKITENPHQKLAAETIGFSYLNQQNFNYTQRTTQFDCEAMVEFKNSLFLFSKNWKDQTTWVYKIPKKVGNYEIVPVDSFRFNGLVTGADISDDQSKLALLGYQNFEPMLWIFTGFLNNSFFTGRNQLFRMKSLFNAQTEGICFIGNDSLYVSCERTHDFEPQVFLIDLNQIK